MSHIHSPAPTALTGVINERMGQSRAVGMGVISAVMAEMSAQKAGDHSPARGGLGGLLEGTARFGSIPAEAQW